MSETAFSVRTVHLDLPAFAAAFGRRLHEAGVPTTAERAARFAEALALVRPVSRRRLYWTARAVFVSDSSQVKAFDSVFRAVLGARELEPEHDPEDLETAPAPPGGPPPRERESAQRHAGAAAAGASDVSPAPSRGREDRELDEVPVPVAASDEERLRSKRFDALEPGELALLYRLMTRLQVATPTRRTRRAERHRRGKHMDMRRTLRGSMRTAGDPIRLARRRGVQAEYERDIEGRPLASAAMPTCWG